MIKTREQIEQEFENINRPLNLDIQKGRAAVVGEVREWSGKKYKKQGNGKWVEVSDEGKNKRQHLEEFHNNLSKDRHGEFSTYTKEDKERIINEQKDKADKLSDKEFTDEELMGGEKHQKGDKIEFNGVTIHVGKDTSGGQDTLTYKAPDVSDKTFWDLDKLKEKISGGEKEGSGETKDLSQLKRSELEKMVPGYLTMPEFKKWSEAEEVVKNWGNATHYNKTGYDGAARESVRLHKEYKNALINKIEKNKSKVEKTKEKQNHEKGDRVRFYHAGLAKDKTGKIVDYREKNGKIVYDIKIEGTTTIVEDVPQSDIGFKKSLEDHFNNINSELSFEKSQGNDLEKGDMQYALGDIKFKKKGSELKKMIESKKSKLTEEKTEIKIQLDKLIEEYKNNGGSISYDENSIPKIDELKDPCCESVSDYSNIQSKKVQVPNGFWDGQWKLRSICEDIKTLETLQSNLEDNKEYEMTTRQLTCLQ